MKKRKRFLSGAKKIYLTKNNIAVKKTRLRKGNFIVKLDNTKYYPRTDANMAYYNSFIKRKKARKISY